MSDCAHHGIQLADMPRMLSEICAETYSIDQADTSFVHRFDLRTISGCQCNLAIHQSLPELTDFSRNSIAWS